MQWRVRPQTTPERVRIASNAHREHILTMCVLAGGALLATACRVGSIKLWSTDTLQPLYEVHAHGKAINELHADEQFIYTASE
jgi:hypothetical protein